MYCLRKSFVECDFSHMNITKYYVLMNIFFQEKLTIL